MSYLAAEAAQFSKAMADLSRDSTGRCAELSLSCGGRFNLCLAVLKGMADSWGRRAHSYDQPEIHVFDACRDEELNDWLFDQCARPIPESHAACPICVDE